MGNEAKWKANLDKVAYLKIFPGWLSSWEQGVGSTIEHVLPIPEHAAHSVVVLSQGKFIVTPQAHTEPQMVTAGLLAARSQLEQTHSEAFQHYDHLTELDQEAGRTARLENILNAIDNNLERIPELKTRIKELVSQWDNESQCSP
jgi:hypothetical protein